jgi:uncharacterized protein RhaS with RHS repeats
MQQRYYDPVIGRFYSNDPVDMLGHMQRGNPTMGFNRYAYANNNPYKYTDPDGEFGIGFQQAFKGDSGALRSQFMTQNSNPALLAQGQIESARDSLQNVSDVSGAASIAATAMAQPELALPLAGISAATGMAAAALSENPGEAMAVEAVSNLVPGKALGSFSTIAKGVMDAKPGSVVDTVVNTAKEVGAKVYGDKIKENLEEKK